MSHPEVHGVVVLARNGDRSECVQDPITYEPGSTESTPLGEVQAHQLGTYLRNTYLNTGSSSHIRSMHTDLVKLPEVHIRVKVGGEGAVVFDSATAVLQGLFPPNPNNKMTLANETTVVAPLNGYQYVPVETVEPSNDRSLEPWTDCPAFQDHVKKVLGSSEFKQVEKDAQPFFNDVKDFVQGRPTTLTNMWNVFDFMNSELTHNKTYAHRLPPTFMEQARGLVNYRENAIFSDPAMGGIGNIASRTVLSSILGALQRIAYNGDPLQLMLIQTTYQPFISLFHQTDIIKSHPELAGLPDYGSALAIELRRAPPPDVREFLRFKFKNGTSSDFETLHVFGHHEDIPLTEFIYRLENSVINGNKEWAKVCSTGSADSLRSTLDRVSTGNAAIDVVCATMMLAATMVLGLWLIFKSVRLYKRRKVISLPGQEELQTEHIGEVRSIEKSGAPYRD